MGQYARMIDRVQERGGFNKQKVSYWAKKNEGLAKMTERIDVTEENRDVAEMLEAATLGLFVPPSSLCDNELTI